MCPNRVRFEETGAEGEFSLEHSPLIFPQRWINSKLPSWLQGSQGEEPCTEKPEAWFCIRRGREFSVYRSAHSPCEILSCALTNLWFGFTQESCRRWQRGCSRLRPRSSPPGRGHSCLVNAFSVCLRLHAGVWLLRPSLTSLPAATESTWETRVRGQVFRRGQRSARSKKACDQDYFRYSLIQRFYFLLLLL